MRLLRSFSTLLARIARANAQAKLAAYGAPAPGAVPPGGMDLLVRELEAAALAAAAGSLHARAAWLPRTLVREAAARGERQA